MTYIPSKLRDLVQQAGGAPVEISSVETLLGWYKAQRRSPHVVQQIRAGLAELGVLSEPDFEGAFLEAPVRLVPIENAVKDSEQDLVSEPGVTHSDPISAFVDPTYRVARLEAANRIPIMFRPEMLLTHAVTLMLKDDLSQIPVKTSERSIVGLLSWKSLGSALALGKKCTVVRDCMSVHNEIRNDTSLFSAISSIIEYEHAVVKDPTGKVCGIITSADLSVQFGRLGEPFLLIGEVENHLRKIIDMRCSKEIVRAAKDPQDLRREISSAADLSFGEYIRLLEKEQVWSDIGLHIDKKLFITLLSDVRRIRNDVMHFDPDGIEPTDLKLLRELVHLLRTLAYYGAI